MVQDLHKLSLACKLWRRQDGIATLAAKFRDKWRTVPRDVVKSWLEQDSEVGGQTLSDSLYNVSEIQSLIAEDGSFLRERAGCSDKESPGSLLTVTNTGEYTDDEE